MPHIDYIGANGEKYPSATELTSLLPQAWLWSWYRSQVKAHGWRGWQRCKATSKRGMAIGSEIHSLIEGFIKKEPFAVSGKYESQLFADALFDEANKIVREWVAVEPHVKSEELRIHGTADAIVKLDDGLAVWDWKSSASKSDTHRIQLAIYALCWNEEHPDQYVDRGIIARIDKKSKRLGVKLDIYENLKQYLPVIRALKLIWDFNNEK